MGSVSCSKPRHVAPAVLMFCPVVFTADLLCSECMNVKCDAHGFCHAVDAWHQFIGNICNDLGATFVENDFHPRYTIAIDRRREACSKFWMRLDNAVPDRLDFVLIF